ncbi:hypothetical protein Zmor_005937 [Zophobas morio]|uniref:THAP domain-containing protein 9 n=1 Tax=Zophobas morio TaxID=2755281 RepID=A0AA38ITW7_9CUCU|nr:hypothetical protein Zmor_005937 [Zophobas morio]
MNAEQKATLINQCLEKVAEAGVYVASITFDGAPVNIATSKKLGCKFDGDEIQSRFKHPTMATDVDIFFDPCHMLKLVRNCLGEKGCLVDGEDNLILWRFIEQLHDFQQKEQFHLANTLRSQHVNFRTQKMKVKLASQVFSKSVADALEFVKDQISLPQFHDAAATIKFIRIFDMLFDVLNSRNMLQVDYKKPISASNYEKVNNFLTEADQYIISIKTSRVNSSSILRSSRATGFLGFRICVRSLRNLFQKLISTENPRLRYLPMYKISQDHIELFFSSIRAHGGYNNNPSVRQFKSAYKKMLVHVQLKDNFRGNCIPLEHVTVLNNLSPIHNINLSTPRRRVLDVNPELTADQDAFDHDYLLKLGDLTEASSYIITYIAGYVVFYLQKRICCEECLNSLVSVTRDLDIFALIKVKDRGGLQYPSKDVIDVCSRAERILKPFIISSDKKFGLTLNFLEGSLLKSYLGNPIFSSLDEHILDQPAMDNHKNYLIKAIGHRYFNVRLYYLGKESVNQANSERHKNNKLTLFKGQ